MSGKVSVRVSRTGNLENSTEVVKLRDGYLSFVITIRDGFGDLALVNDEPRAATILTTEFCQLVSIDRSDFTRIVKSSYEKELKEKILFLKKFPLLSGFSPPALKAIAQVMEWKKFQPGACILEEGARARNFYIVRNGEAVVLRNLKLPSSGKYVKVAFGTLKRHDYFGEEGVHFLDSDPNSHLSDIMTSSIFASKICKEVEVGSIACFDAKTKISQIPKNTIHSPCNGEILRIYHEQKLRKKWDKQKKIFFDKMIQERMMDPNITSEKWNKMTKKKKKLWV